ncbi:MAG: O-antigen ligase family protein [Bacteroidota bacterium]|nr:O-antigen ligase family protein [Bacteroidota bacterium]
MIFRIAYGKPGFWLGFHFVLGIVSAFSRFALIAWVLVVLLNSIMDLFSKRNADGMVHFFLSYYLGFEVWGRMVHATPFIPDESGKYLQFFFILFGILFGVKRKVGPLGFVLIFLSIPSILVAPLSYDYFRYDYMYNTMGFIVLALAISYFQGVRLTHRDISGMLRLMMMGLMGILGYLLIKTPSFDELNLGLVANADAAGGFGPNQVSTILGVGFALFGISFLFRVRLMPNIFWQMGILLYLSFRVLLTLSRGGAITGITAMLLPFLYLTLIGKIKAKIFGWGIGALVLMAGIVYFVNEASDNALFMRYTGETYATTMGLREKDLDVVTSGRIEIIESDFQIFFDNMIMGIGPGRSAYERLDYEIARKIAPHTLATQLLAEHGIFGVAMSLIFLLYPVILFFRRPKWSDRSWMLMCFSLAILSSFHSATRTIITPLFYGLAVARIQPYVYKNPLSRKRARQEGVESLDHRYPGTALPQGSPG